MVLMSFYAIPVLRSSNGAVLTFIRMAPNSCVIKYADGKSLNL